MTPEPQSSNNGRRYWRFIWDDLNALPEIGANDYQPKGGLLRWYDAGVFHGEHLEVFPAIKNRQKLELFGRCIYCGHRSLNLSSEHVIPEFLGAGLELPASSCSDCQVSTSAIENSIATEMFNPIRSAFGLQGKNGVLQKRTFPVNVGRLTSDYVFIPLMHHPTVLVMPFLHPASTYSRRPIDADDIINFRFYNINADRSFLEQYSLRGVSTQSVDTVRFSQLIAKIGHVYAMYYFREHALEPTVADFIRTNYPPGAPATGHFEHVGCLWQAKDGESTNLHEIEVGRIDWNDNSYPAVRVRLFASCGMPSYYVTVGKVF
jgi:hypothetical protein